MNKPRFNPNAPYKAHKPKFNPSASYNEVSVDGNSDATNALVGGSYNYVKDEYPDFIDWQDRAVVKNFGSHNPNGSISYLQKLYPNKSFRLNDGEIEVGSNGEWYKLDPSMTASLASPSEFARDIVDIGSDTAGGALEGAASVAGFASGGPLGAALANSGASMATEGAKQAIGSMAGIPDNLSASNVAISGATGLVAPALFGAGKVPMNRLSKKGLQDVANKFGLESTEHVTQAHVDKFTQGLVGKGWDGFKQNVAPAIGQVISGADRFGIKSYANNIDHIDAMIADPIAANADIEARHNRLLNFFTEKENQIGAEIVDSIRNSGNEVNIKSVNDYVNSQIAKRRFDGASPELLDQAAALESWQKKVFGKSYPDQTQEVQTLVRRETPRPPKVVESRVEYQLDPTISKETAYGKVPFWLRKPEARDSLGVTKRDIEKTASENVPVLIPGIDGELPIYSRRQQQDGTFYHGIHEGVNPDKAQFRKEIHPIDELVPPDGFNPSRVDYERQIPGEKKVAVGRKLVPQEPLVVYVPQTEKVTTNPGREGFFNKNTWKHEILPNKLGDSITGEEAVNLNRSLTGHSKWNKDTTEVIQGTAKGAQGELRKALEAANPKTQDGKDAYKQLLAIEELVGVMGARDPKNRATPAAREAFEKEMSRRPKSGKTTREAGLASLESLGYDLNNDREIMAGYKFGKNDNIFPLSGEGTTSTSRTIAIKDAGNALAKTAALSGAGFAVGGASTGLLGLPLLFSGPKSIKGVIKANDAANKATNWLIDENWLARKLGAKNLVTPLTKDQLDEYLQENNPYSY